MDGNNATEQAAGEFDDTEIKCLLLGDENDRQKAGDTLLQQFGFRLMGISCVVSPCCRTMKRDLGSA